MQRSRHRSTMVRMEAASSLPEHQRSRHRSTMVRMEAASSLPEHQRSRHRSTMVRMEAASSLPEHLLTLSTAKASKLSLLVKSPLWRRNGRYRHSFTDSVSGFRNMEMNPVPDSTASPSNNLRLMQWNANGNRGKITKLLTFLHSNNFNIAVIQETKLTNKTKPLKTPGWPAVRRDRRKNKGSGLPMLIKDTIPFVDNTSADPRLEQQGISTTMPNRHQLHIYFPPRSSCIAGHNTLIAQLLSINEMPHIVWDSNAHHSRWDSNTDEDEEGKQQAGEIDAADYTILSENEALRLARNGR